MHRPYRAEADELPSQVGLSCHGVAGDLVRTLDQRGVIVLLEEYGRRYAFWDPVKRAHFSMRRHIPARNEMSDRTRDQVPQPADEGDRLLRTDRNGQHGLG